MGDVAVQPRTRRTRLLGALTGAGLVAAAFAGYLLVHTLAGGGGGTAASTARAPARVPPVVSAVGLERASGIRITQVAITGDGGLVDLRYQVVDPDKAVAVHTIPPELVDETTGAVVDQLLMGHQHKGTLRAGQAYYLIFVNPGNLVQRGRRVTVALGGVRIPHIRVK
jgi:hypothetical protein